MFEDTRRKQRGLQVLDISTISLSSLILSKQITKHVRLHSAEVGYEKQVVLRVPMQCPVLKFCWQEGKLRRLSQELFASGVMN